MLSRYLPDQYTRVRSGGLALDSTALALDRVQDTCCAVMRLPAGPDRKADREH